MSDSEAPAWSLRFICFWINVVVIMVVALTLGSAFSGQLPFGIAVGVCFATAGVLLLVNGCFGAVDLAAVVAGRKDPRGVWMYPAGIIVGIALTMMGDHLLSWYLAAA